MNIITKTMLLSVASLPLLLAACNDNRTTGEKWGDAVEDLGEGRGIGNAAEELKDRSPAERVGDAIEDVGQDIEREAR